MKILVACEYSGRVREAFRAKGHDAWSCDYKATEIPGHHVQTNVLELLEEGWDMMVAHPPCTFLAVSGNRWYSKVPLWRETAANFVLQLASAPIPMICIENPIGVLSTLWRKPDQIIQPWMFGDPYQKSTCLWLKNLPKLIPTNIVSKGEFVVYNGKKLPKWYSSKTIPRDKTFQGIADAMAEQWGG